MSLVEKSGVGFVNGRELKEGDIIEFQIKRLAGKDYDPPVIHRGVVCNPMFAPYRGKGHRLDWVVQIRPSKTNDRLPNYEFSDGVMAIYGADIVGFADQRLHEHSSLKDKIADANARKEADSARSPVRESKERV